MPTRLQFTPDPEWRTRFESCVRRSSLDSSDMQITLARRALLQKIFIDGVTRAEKSLGLAKNDRKELERPRQEDVPQNTQQPPESMDEYGDELREWLETLDFDDPDNPEEEASNGRAN